MADTALQRFKTDQALEQERKNKTKQGEIRDLDEFQSTFLKAIENISEPKKHVRYLKPFNPFISCERDNTLSLPFMVLLPSI